MVPHRLEANGTTHGPAGPLQSHSLRYCNDRLHGAALLLLLLLVKVVVKVVVVLLVLMVVASVGVRAAAARRTHVDCR